MRGPASSVKQQFAEDDGELCHCLGPLARRAFTLSACSIYSPGISFVPSARTESAT